MTALGEHIDYTLTFTEYRTGASSFENDGYFIIGFSSVGYGFTAKTVYSGSGGLIPIGIIGYSITPNAGTVGKRSWYASSEQGEASVNVTQTASRASATLYTYLDVSISYSLMNEATGTLTYKTVVTTVWVPTQYNYTTPWLSASARRSASDNTKMLLDLNVVFTSGSLGKQSNTLTIQYRRKTVTASTWSSWIATTVTKASSVSSPITLEPTASFVAGSTYNIQVRATDALGNSFTAETILYADTPLWVEYPQLFCIYGDLDIHSTSNPNKYMTISYPFFPKGTVLQVYPMGRTYPTIAAELEEKYGGDWYYWRTDYIDREDGGAQIPVYIFICE